MPLLTVKGLELHYRTSRGSLRAVDKTSFSLEKGEALGLVGESGSGKSSLGAALLRMLPNNVALYQGSVIFDGMDVMELSNEQFRRQIRWKTLSMVFQGAMNALNPVLKVGPQIGETLVQEGAFSKADVQSTVEDLLELVGLPKEVFRRYPHELSGGMKQRAVIAMALLHNPALVILDEPTSALDVSLQAQITNLLKRLKRDLNLSLIFITHDIALASDLCDHIGVVYGGQLVELGSIEKVLEEPQHPYTQKLLASLPRLFSDSVPEFIPGTPPDLVEPPSGCRFHPRCPYVFDQCSKEAPTLYEIGPQQSVRCWLHAPENAGQ